MDIFCYICGIMMKTTRQLAEGKEPLPEGKPKEHQKAILG